jgi:hypothetical protein
MRQHIVQLRVETRESEFILSSFFLLPWVAMGWLLAVVEEVAEWGILRQSEVFARWRDGV